tara:strand:+ start:1639 stop:1773 length:135 start_codon:yes stop_codon:yes gene_type:complete
MIVTKETAETDYPYFQYVEIFAASDAAVQDRGALIAPSKETRNK